MKKFFRKDKVGWMQGIVIWEKRHDRHCLFGPAWTVWSILTTGYFTEVLEGILLPPMFAELQSTRLRRDEVPTAITSVLSVFNMSLLLFIHDKTSPIHVWMPVCTEKNSSGGALWESSVSSAYLWKSQPWAEITSDRGWEYNVNKTGPRNERFCWSYTSWLVPLDGACVSRLHCRVCLLFRWQYEGPDLTPLKYHLNNSQTTCSESIFMLISNWKSSAMNNTLAVLKMEIYSLL